MKSLGVLSYLILGVGIICVSLSLIFSNTHMGGYRDCVEIRQEEPRGFYQERGWDYEVMKSYWWDVCVDKREPEYVLIANTTLGTLSRGEVIEIERLFFGGAKEGYAWNEQAYQVVNGQMISVPHQDLVIRRSFDSSKMNGSCWLQLLENGKICDDLGVVRAHNGVADESWSLSFEVAKEGMSYALQLIGDANQPFYIAVYYKVVTMYGRLEGPMLYQGFLLIGVGIVGSILSMRRPRERSRPNREKAPGRVINE